MRVRITELDSIEQIRQIHEEIFGMPFPYESYEKKAKLHTLYVYGYYEHESLVGYSIIINQAMEKNLYAWYGGLLAEYQGYGTTIKFFDIMVEKARELEYNSISLATTNCRPNMLILAVKYGFDIYDIKKRDYGEGSKIYFKYPVCPACNITISLKNENGTNLKIPELEKLLVSAYKHNCKKIVFLNILDESDIKLINYAMRYCKKFLRAIDFEFRGNQDLIAKIYY